MKVCWKFTHLHAIQDVDEFISSSEQIWRNYYYNTCSRMLFSEWVLSSSGEKYVQMLMYRCTDTVLYKYVGEFSCERTIGDGLFPWEALLWNMAPYFGLNDVFVYYKHAAFHFTRHTLMDWRCVDYCYVFISCFGLSFWRHPFTAKDPLVSKWYNAKFLQICSNGEKTHLHFGRPGGEWIFSLNYSFKIRGQVFI